MIDALLIAASIAIGTGLVLSLTSSPDGGDGGMMTLTSTQIGQLAAQFFLAGAGTLSFAVLFACPKRTLPCCALVGAVAGSSTSWLSYTGPTQRQLPHRDHPAVAGGAYLRRAAQDAGDGLLLTGIFPLVPGAGIYYTAYYFIQGENALSLANGISTFKVAVALAVASRWCWACPCRRGIGGRANKL